MLLYPQRRLGILSNYYIVFKAYNVSAIGSDVCLTNGELTKAFWEERWNKTTEPRKWPGRVKTPPLLTLFVGRFLTHLGSWPFYLRKRQWYPFKEFCVGIDQGNRGRIKWQCARSVVNKRWPVLLVIICLCLQVPPLYLSWVVHIWNLLCKVFISKMAASEPRIL